VKPPFSIAFAGIFESNRIFIGSLENGKKASLLPYKGLAAGF